MPKGGNFKVTPLSEQDDVKRILYYGDVGTAKTTNLAYMATLGKTLFLDKESGLKRKPLERRGVPVDRIGKIRADNYQTVEDVYWKLKRDPKDVKGVIIDSATDLQQSVLEEVTEEKAQAKRNRGFKDVDPFHATMDDRQKVNEMMRRIVRRFRDLELNLGIAALVRQDTYEDDDEEEHVRLGPALTPGIQQDICGYMDVVIYCRTVEVGGEVEYQGITQPTQRWMAKDRFGMLPRTLVNPTFDRVVAYIDGDLVVEQDSVMQEARDRRKSKKGK